MALLSCAHYFSQILFCCVRAEWDFDGHQMRRPSTFHHPTRCWRASSLYHRTTDRMVNIPFHVQQFIYGSVRLHCLQSKNYRGIKTCCLHERKLHMKCRFPLENKIPAQNAQNIRTKTKKQNLCHMMSRLGRNWILIENMLLSNKYFDLWGVFTF